MSELTNAGVLNVGVGQTQEWDKPYVVVDKHRIFGTKFGVDKHSPERRRIFFQFLIFLYNPPSPLEHCLISPDL